MTIHLEQKRYSAVIGADGEIFLRGVLDESSDLQQTLALIRERFHANPNTAVQLDFTHLAAGSWNGFLSLDKMLADLNLNYVLRHVSFDLFRYVALLPTLRKSKLGEIELALVSGGSGHDTVQVSGEQAISQSASGRFARIGGQEVVGRYSFIFGDKITSIGKASGKTEFDTWYDYISFAAITLALAEDLARSIAMSVIRLSGELAAEYDAQAIGMTIIQNREHSQKAREAEQQARILTQRARDTESNYGSIILGIKKNVAMAENIQKALHKAEGDQRQPVLDALLATREVRLSLQEIAELIENGGTETFALLISIPGQKLFNDAYEAASAPAAQELQAIREAFSIMDPLSEDDWIETKNAIFSRTEAIERLVSSLIVLTQGFDLLRQIIEHRITEFTAIESYLDCGAPADEFEAFTHQLHEHIRKKMVTDQEKLAVAAFIPGVRDQTREETHRPGEILLF